MCLYIIHFLLAVNYDKKVVQTHFLLLFVNKKYPETYILLWKGGWFWLFTHFANKKPSASPRAFYCCKMCKKSKSPPFLYYKLSFSKLMTEFFQTDGWIFSNQWMNLSKLIDVFFQIDECICQNCQLHSSKLMNVFVQIEFAKAGDLWKVAIGKQESWVLLKDYGEPFAL